MGWRSIFTLQDRVNSYVGDREAKAAEQAALTLLANERREQRVSPIKVAPS